jgi:hypothetical protein
MRKVGFRTPSLTKRLAARTSVKRVVRHSLGLKVPRGVGMITDPQRALNNRIYNRTTKRVCCWFLVPLVFGASAWGKAHSSTHLHTHTVHQAR